MFNTTFQHGFFQHLQNNFLISNVFQYHYISFEDAFWDLLNSKIDKGETILVPNFFCVDVLNNIIFHGYNYEFYEVKPDFSIDFSQFKIAYKKARPKVILIFHTFGLRVGLVQNEDFFKLIGQNILIEDCVHRLLEQDDLKFKTKNHFFIDSTRKLTPFFGSTLYAKNPLSLNYSKNGKTEQDYAKKTYQFWLKFQILNRLGYILQKEKYFLKAYNFLNSGDNLIGDSKNSVKLGLWQSFLKCKINKEKQEKIREKQCKIYVEKLKKELTDYNFCLPNSYLFDQKNWPNLAFFPIALKSDYAFLLREFLLENGFFTFVEFSDCPWAINKNVLCLPLGLHVKNEEVENICRLVQIWFEKNYILQ